MKSLMSDKFDQLQNELRSRSNQPSVTQKEAREQAERIRKAYLLAVRLRKRK